MSLPWLELLTTVSNSNHDRRQLCSRSWLINKKVYSATFQSRNPFPRLSNSMAKPTTFRLSALKGSKYWLLIICFSAAEMPPFLVSFSSIT